MPVKTAMEKAFTSLPTDYEILRVLGSGANGLVYLARDPQGELCALKEFRVSAVTAQRFFREAAMVFTLVHENIVRCQNLLYGKGDSSFLVFEYVEGGSLRNRLWEATSLPTTEAMDLIRQLALGLHRAHECGIIHCDLKPENILLHREDGASIYKIADLGIARYQQEMDAAIGTPGSPAYMAPEQFYGQTDARTDLYALGIILFEALSGNRPFEGPPAALFTLHANQAPDLSVIQDPACAQLIGRLLAKEPSDRVGTAAELLTIVESILAGTWTTESVRPSARAMITTESCQLAVGGPLNVERVVFALDVSGALGMVPLFTPDSARILISDHTASDLVDLHSARNRPRFVPEIATACGGAYDVSRILFSTNRFIRTFDSSTCMTRTLFPHQTHVVALCHEDGADSLIYATMRTVFRATLAGRVLWHTECRNYTRPPHIVGTAHGETLVSSGPVFPSIYCLAADGVVHRQIPMESPVLALRSGLEPGCFSAVLQGMGGDSTARCVHYRDYTQQHAVELGTGIFNATWHRDVLSLFFTDGRIRLLNERMDVLWEYQSTGIPLADCWHPWQRLWTVLERRGREAWLRTFTLTTQELAATAA